MRIIPRILFLMSLLATPVGAATAYLSWNAVTQDAEGRTLIHSPRYRAYYGTTSQRYTTMMDTGFSTTASLSGLRGATTYYFTVTAYNAVGESGYATEVSMTTPLEDTVAPTVVITSHSDGTIVPRKAQVVIEATASDEGVVVSVEFYVNDQLICTDDVSAYRCVWRVPGPPRRAYTLRAVAYDVAGNAGSSATVTVTSH